MSNFNSDVIKTILEKDPIALDFYISPYIFFFLFTEAVLSFNFLR